MKKRKNKHTEETLADRIFMVICLLILWACLIYFEYNFESLIWNGIIILLTSILYFGALSIKNEKTKICKKERKKEILMDKFIFLTFLLALWVGLIYFDYGFTHLLWNGVVIFLTSFLSYLLLSSEGYYIETGYQESDKTHQEVFRAYAILHPWKVFYRQVLATFTLIMFWIAGGSIIAYFFV